MIAATVLGIFLFATPVQSDFNYSGKYKTHPNYAQFLAAVNAAQEEARMLVPKKLGVAMPEFTLELVDLDTAATQDSVWPPRGGIRKLYEILQGQRASIYLQVDYFIANPNLVRPSLIREFAKAALIQSKKDQGNNRWGFRASGIWLLEELASQVAGVIDSETAYTICYSVNKGEKVETLLGKLTQAPAPKSMRQMVIRDIEYEGRLTPHFTAKLIMGHPDGEKDYIELLESMYRGQPFDSALKKVTGKNIDQFNAALATDYKNYLAKNLPKADLDLYKKIVDALEQNKPEDALKSADELLKKSPNSILLGNIHFLRGRALQELKKPEAAESFRIVLNKFRSTTPLAKEAQYQLALFYKETGDTVQAKNEFERLRDDFGWDQESIKRAKEALEKLGQ